MDYIIAYDLGTGGTKASLFKADGEASASYFAPCSTYYPEKDFREQKPEEWWDMVVQSTRGLLDKSDINSADIRAVAVSGHSLGVVPMSGNGELLLESVPIWSDARAGVQAANFFKNIDEKQWYLKTGNGFPAALYSIFKILWYRDNMPDVYSRSAKFIGTKDYINFRMTGVMATDFSYASGSGVYDLKGWKYDEDLLRASGVEKGKMPEILSSTEVIGEITCNAAKDLGLPQGIKVVCGGVDNACMAAGAGCIENGKAYTSLGTSSWIAVSSDVPIVDNEKRPYVFTHIVPGQFVSATAIFSAGNSYRWVRDTLCRNLLEAEARGEGNAYELMNALAAKSPLGANKLIFNPSLAGGSSLDDSVNIRGTFAGLDLAHSQADIIRAALEGISLNLRIAMDVLASYTRLSDDMLLVGGGGKSPFWRQLFADIYNKNITESRVGEDAGSLGAAAAAAVGAGLWKDFSPLVKINQRTGGVSPNAGRAAEYEKILAVFIEVARRQSEIGDLLHGIGLNAGKC
ncbi:MAG: FGGY-family carbohydrate kinase [Spirochaetales bacterium]|nr:FGGY-family carbohydrate kinase [Spirochaetales bacterium]